VFLAWYAETMVATAPQVASSTAARRVEVVYDVPETDERWVLEEENVPESALHDEIILLLVEILKAWARRSARDVRVGRNLALRWNQALPKVGVDPDVYVVEPAPPEGDDTRSLCTWKPGHAAPRVAVEVVSETTAEKDYAEGPDKYAASGTGELWVFDPLEAGPSLRGGPFVLQVWRRDAKGRFRRVYAGDGPVRSEALGAWLVVTEGGRRLRVAEDAEGRRLWPTEAEEARAEVARLRAELDGLRRG
jgi:Uma2 family endonuclease